MKKLNLFFAFITLYVTPIGEINAQSFDYSKYLFDPPSTLSLNIEVLNKTTGYVKINGYVAGFPQYISWDWRDGTTQNGWFFWSIPIATVHKIILLR